MDKKDFLFRFVPQVQRSKLQLDDEALFSTTDQLTADKISKDIRKIVPTDSIITDATACIGGSAYSLSRIFHRINAIEIDNVRYKALMHNMLILGASNVDCMYGDAIDICKNIKQDVIFLDPPWGGPEYKEKTSVSLFLSGRDIADVCKELAPHTQYIAMKVPTNFDEALFIDNTKSSLKLVLRNGQLRKMNLLVFQTTFGENIQATNR